MAPASRRPCAGKRLNTTAAPRARHHEHHQSSVINPTHCCCCCCSQSAACSHSSSSSDPRPVAEREYGSAPAHGRLLYIHVAFLVSAYAELPLCRRSLNAGCHFFARFPAVIIVARAKSSLARLVRLGNTTLVARALVLVTADLLVLTLALLHERSQLRIVILCDRLGRHLDLAVTARVRNVLLDVEDGLFEACDTCVLVETLRRQD